MAVYLVWVVLVWYVVPVSSAVCENEISELRSLVNQQAVMIKNIQKNEKHSKDEAILLRNEVNLLKDEVDRLKSPIHKDKSDVNMLGGTRMDKRLLADSIEGLDNIAFYAYMNANEPLQKHHTLVFDVTKLNLGHGYSNSTGAFTVPKHGLYIFTFTLHSYHLSYASVQLLVNNEVQGTIFTDSSEGWQTNAASVTIPVWANQGDQVFVRTHPTYGSSGSLFSYDVHRCSFAGWKV